MDQLYELQADVLKVLANPRRLAILHALTEGPREVGRLATEVGASQPNISQHLALLRAAGLVVAERHGREVRYGLVDPDVMVACQLMRGVLARHHARLAAAVPAATLSAAARRAGLTFDVPAPDSLPSPR